MDINEFTSKFSEVFDDDVNLTPETYFKELESFSSMTTLAIIAFVDENFDKELSGKELKDVETVQDLFELIKTKE